MKTYYGMRAENGCSVVIEEDGEFTGLPPRNDLHNHSPDGFEWGYGGSGPAQLALALAADVLDDDGRAQDVYQQLKFKLIGGLPHEGWVLTENRLRAAIDTIEQEQQHAQGR
jgi:hypothetical protein